MRDLRLKLIAHVDFRKAPETNWNELKKDKKIPPLKKGEGILLISKTGNLMQFVTPTVEFDTVNTADREVRVTIQASERFKIRGGTWSPLMLANYAEQVGYRIVGIKRFEWYFKEYRDAA